MLATAWRRRGSVRVAAGEFGRCDEDGVVCRGCHGGNEDEGCGWMRWNKEERERRDDDGDRLCENAAAATTTAAVVMAGAVVAFGLGGGEVAAHAHGLDAINEVTSVAEGEDFWTNVLRYITFFITIVTGFITFAVKYV